MSVVKSFKPGQFCWADLSAGNSQRSKEFYMNLFGWEKSEMPLGNNQTYTMLKLKGHDVVGLSDAPDEEKKQGIPPHWNVYISVTDVDESLKRAQSLGAKVLAGPMDVFDSGRMAFMADPTGAVVALWQAKTHQGSGIRRESNTLCWFELATKDQKRATVFYSELFGYRTNVSKITGEDYIELNVGDEGVGGIIQMTEQWGPVPPHWAVYFAVDHCDDTCVKVAKLGGKVILGPMDIPKVGRFAALADPDGAVFHVITMAAQ